MVEYRERLALAMKQKGIKTALLSERLGVSYQAVKKALDGGKFSAVNNSKAARILGVRPDWLATGIGTMNNDGPQALEQIYEQGSIKNTLLGFAKLFDAKSELLVNQLRPIVDALISQPARANELIDMFESTLEMHRKHESDGVLERPRKKSA